MKAGEKKSQIIFFCNTAGFLWTYSIGADGLYERTAGFCPAEVACM